MNRTRRSRNKNAKSKGVPPIDAQTLKPESIKKGTDGFWWWVGDSGEWQRVNKNSLKPRKTAKKNKSKVSTLGLITVKYNHPDKCSLLGSKDCSFPVCSDFVGSLKSDNPGSLGEWHHAYTEGLPLDSEPKYVKYDQYMGNLSVMSSAMKQLKAHYAKYKRNGSISEFEIKGVPY
jgi:hypothetical protein